MGTIEKYCLKTLFMHPGHDGRSSATIVRSPTQDRHLTSGTIQTLPLEMKMIAVNICTIGG